MRLIFFFAAAAICTAFAACSSSNDDTIYGPPDAGQPDANYCIGDLDCPTTDAGQTQACGFAIADTCEARGVCVDFASTAPRCGAGTELCGCNADIVDSCGMPSGFVRGGPTNGQARPADAGAKCGVGSN